MGDRFNYYHEEILSRLDDILRALRQQSTYGTLTGNMNLVGGATEVAGVSATLGGIEVLHDLVGSLAATAALSGNMLATWGAGTSAASSSAAATMQISKELVGLIADAIGVAGVMYYSPALVGAIAAAGAAAGAIVVTENNEILKGSLSSVASVTGYLQGGTSGGGS